MQIKKALLCMTLIISLCLPQFAASAAEELHPQAILDSESASETLIDVWAGTTKVTPQVSTVGGRTGWKTDVTNDESAKNIYCDVDDSYLFNNITRTIFNDVTSMGDAVEIEVEYYDGDAGLFNLIYGSVHATVGWERYATEYEYPVELKGTNTWKTHTFRLYDTRFANEYNDADFVIRTYNRGDTTVDVEDVEYHNMYYKPGDIVFGSIKVRKIPIVAQPETGKVGNIFFGTGEKNISVAFENTTDNTISTTVTYELVSDQTGETVWTSSGDLTLYPKQTPKKIVRIPFEKYGTYMLNISTSATDNAAATLRETECSVVVDNDDTVRDDRFGVNTHIADLYWGFGKYREELSELSAKTGSGWIREPIRWDIVEESEGVFDIPDYAMNTIDALLEKGIKPLVILTGYNEIYDSATALPFDDDTLAKFQKYCENVARELKGKVDTFESWNEYPYNKLNDTTIEESADFYIKLIKATRDGIIAGNPDAKLVGLDLASVPNHFIRMVAERGGLDYMDAVSVHPYSTAGDPDDSIYIPYMSELKTIMDTYAKDKEVWVTEIGWSNTINTWVTANVIEDFSYEEEAEWQVKVYAYSLAMELADKIFIYDLMNDGYHYGGKESNYGMIESCYAEEGVQFAAQPAYVGAAFLTKMLNGTVSKGYTLENNNYKFGFERNDGTKVDVIWNTENGGDIVLILPEGGTTVIYDIYGNIIATPDSNAGLTYTHTLGTAPIYVEYTDDSKGLFYRTLVEDDFDGSAIDTTKWNANSGTESQLSLSNSSLKLYDIYDNAGIGTALSEPITTGKIKIKCDLYVTSEYMNQKSASDGTGNAVNGEIILYGGNGIAKGNEIVYLRPNEGFTIGGVGGAICKPTANTWYNVDVEVDVATQMVVVRVTPEGGETVTKSAICTSTALASTSQISFGARYLNLGTKSHILVDNVSISKSSKEPVISYDIDSANGEATVTASLSTADMGADASLIILKQGRTFENLETDPMASVIYVNQGEVNEQGKYSAKFAIPEGNGVYKAYLAFDGYDERYDMSVIVGSDFVMLSDATQDGKIVANIDKLDKTKDMKVTVLGFNGSGTTMNMELIYAFYNKGTLTGIYEDAVSSSDKEIAEYGIAEGPLNEGRTFDQVKVFLWNSIDGAVCLCKNLVLE